MGEIEVLQSWLGTGADAGMIALAVAVFRMERRLLKLELSRREDS